MEENTIPITDWADSPLDSAVSYGPEGSIEAYWAKMTTTYAEAENGSLDDQFEKEFADDIFDVFHKSGDGEEESEGSEEGDVDGEGDEQGRTLLSFAQGMMQDEDEDDDDYESDDDYDNDEKEDDDSGIDIDETNYQQQGGEESMLGMQLGDMHPNHTPLEGSSSYSQRPPRLSPEEMKHLAASYKIEQSGDEHDEGGGAAGFLLDSDDDDDDAENDLHSSPAAQQANKSKILVNKKLPQQQLQQQQKKQQQRQPEHPQQNTEQRSQRVKPPPTKLTQKQPSHPFLRQEGGGGGSKKKKNKKEIEKKHKMLLLAIVQKKQQEEEELLQAVLKAEAKRKKFKEALLEKAIRSKQMKAEEEAEKEHIRHIEQEIKTAENEAKNLAPPRPRRTKPPAVARPAPQLTQQQQEEMQEADEAALQQEEDEARAKMEAAVKARKRFVKNQKAILAALQAKKEEKALQQEQEKLEQQRLRDLKRKRNEKFLRQREQKKSEQEEQEQQGDGEGGGVVEARVGVGSALSAVRATRSQEGGCKHTNSQNQTARVKPVPISRSTSATNAPSTPEGEEGREGGKKEGRAPRRRLKKVQQQQRIPSLREQQQQAESEKAPTEEDPAARERRREEGRQRQEKVSQQLALLAEQRREAEQLAKRKEERAKVRAELLRQRVQLEYSERKLMAIEDKFVNGDTKMRKPLMGAVPVPEIKKPKKKITTEMAVAMVDRMQTKKLQARQQAEGGEAMSMADVTSQLLPPARDFLDWKKKHGVPVSDDIPGVFCMTGWYPCVKEALLERGWVHNQDHTSPHFDLKWTLKSSDVTKGSLQPWQLTNHFLKNIALTTKVGLMRSLQQLNWIADISPDEIFPRGYDLSSPLEIQEFIDDFRHDHVVNLLKRLYLQVTGLETPKMESDCPSSSPPSQTKEESEEELYSSSSISTPPPPIVPSLDDVLVNKAVLNACFNVLTRFLAPYFADNGVDQEITVRSQKITAMEWELVNQYDMYTVATLPEGVCEEAVDEFLRDKEREAALTTAQALSSLEKKKAITEINHRARKEQYHYDKERERAREALKQLIPLGSEGLARIHELLCQCKIVAGTQYGINGNASGARNMWIVKPAAKSRGRGIMAFNDLRKLLAYVELGKAGKSILTSSQWIVQKYMENPLIIANRKFDFRQWVLVMSWNPLTVYFYDEFYCRFSAEDYDTSDEAMANTFVHLVNNSIGKNNENFHKPIIAANGETINEFMWSDKSFTEYCKFITKTDDTIKAIKSRMRDIAVWSLMCGADAIEHRKNSWELYGFDFMMDDQWTPWLIEINSSPACDYSTKVTERYIKKALVEILTVTLDMREWEKLPKGSGRPEKPDTGGWECIYTGPAMEMNSFGTDMCVQGEPMKVPRKRQVIGVQRQQPVMIPQEEEEKEEKEEKGTNRGEGGGSRNRAPRSGQQNTFSQRTPDSSSPLNQGTNQSQRQPQSEISRSPIESSSSCHANKFSSSSSQPHSIANLVQQNDTEGLKAQASPIDFDDSDDDLSVERIEDERESSSKRALDQLDNAQLTAHVRELVAVSVPVTVQKFEMPISGAEAAGGAVPPANKSRQVLKKAGGGRSKGPSSSGGATGPAASVIPIPIKTYDPFA